MRKRMSRICDRDTGGGRMKKTLVRLSLDLISDISDTGIF